MSRKIYKRAGKLYLDYYENGKRVRQATGLKDSSLAMDFIRKNYDLFIKDKGKAKKLYFEFEDSKMTDFLNGKTSALLENKALNSTEYFLEQFLLEKSFLKKTSQFAYAHLASNVLAIFSELNIQNVKDFRREHSVLFIQILKNRGYKIKTITLYSFILKNFFNYLLSNDIIEKNPFCPPKMSVADNHASMFNPFNLGEIQRLISSAQGDLRTYLLLGFFTGARTGEILALQFRDIDFENKEIHITKTLFERTSIGIGTPKTKTSYRSIDMLEVVENELLALSNGVCGDEFIIKTPRWILRKLFYSLQKELGFKLRRLYDTRHSFASVMLSKGEEPMWVGVKMMGHKDLNETFKTYAKYLPKAVKERALFLKGMKF